MARLPTFPYLVNRSPDGAADAEPFARFRFLPDATDYVDLIAARAADRGERAVWRVRRAGRPGVLHSAGTPAQP